MLAAVILSGGASQRMGSPKALLPYQGRPFLEHLLDVTRHPKIGVRRVGFLPRRRRLHLDPDELQRKEPVLGLDMEGGVQLLGQSLEP